MLNRDLIFLHQGSVPLCNVYMEKRFEGYYTLQFMESGAVSLSYDNNRQIISGPHFWCHYPGPNIILHPADKKKTWHHRYLAFSGPLAVKWHSEGLFPEKAQKAPKRKNWPEIFDRLLYLDKRTDSIGTMKRINILESILIDLAENRQDKTRHEPWFEYAATRINDTEGYITYGKLAKECNMALSTLRRKFRENAGIPLHEYSLQVRAAKAKELLANTNKPIKEIAPELGFEDTGYFNRSFKKATGVTPGLYRKSSRNR